MMVFVVIWHHSEKKVSISDSHDHFNNEDAISQIDLAGVLQAIRWENVLLVDARTKEAYEVGHIPAAEHVANVEKQYKIATLIIIYDDNGIDAQLIAN